MNTTLLVILDGWGWRPDIKDNAIAHAPKPVYDRLWSSYPHTFLHASGQWVGLPEGQIGSSEVGHTIIGAGRNVLQLSTAITAAVRSGRFFSNPVLCNAAAHVLKTGGTLHVMGLTSDGGVHSYWEHLMAVLRLAKERGLGRDQLAIHAILDGRDVGPKTGKGYIEKLKKELETLGIGRIATVMGRYWIMDRDKRWERVAKGYRAVVLGEGVKARDPAAAVGDNYFAGKTDEFIEPVVIMGAQGPTAVIKDGDAVVIYNFRADRARQIARALTDPGFQEFDRGRRPDVHLACMTLYDATLGAPVAFPPESANGGERPANLPEILEEKGIPQLRIAETEKYAHVTYFLSGGKEAPLPHEERIMIPSPKVATYDQTPEMSARAITDKLIEALPRFPVAVCNFANADMVGHTGVFDAAVKACSFVDQCLGRIINKMEELGGAVIITADHGNSERMKDEQGAPHTAHTMSVVPFILWTKPNQNLKLRQDKDAGLRDIAPTILELLGLPQPPGMDGRSLILR
ncbi:MAG: 2,3-bisphosphoglycerate-independent phosphoglycerate mutase [Elusimicrobia bacterium]|nr:2,3-bisphosphoglycerate-independent phosphoglycerate mutase [Elusimicrobiota bacterium]